MHVEHPSHDSAPKKGDVEQALEIMQTGLVRCSQALAAKSPRIPMLLARLLFGLA
jgi:hypothetical protein